MEAPADAHAKKRQYQPEDAVLSVVSKRQHTEDATPSERDSMQVRQDGPLWAHVNAFRDGEFEVSEGFLQKLNERVVALSQWPGAPEPQRSKILCLLRASGGGKSKYMDELSKSLPVISCVLEPTVPPPDSEMLDWLQGCVKNESAEPQHVHAAFYALLYALLSQADAHIASLTPAEKETHSTLTKTLRTNVFNRPEKSTGAAVTRTEGRRAFFEKALTIAKTTYDKLLGDAKWNTIFEQPPAAWRTALHSYAEQHKFYLPMSELMVQMETYHRPLVLHLDGISSLLGTGTPTSPNDERTPIRALYRTMAELHLPPLVFVLTSTNTDIKHLDLGCDAEERVRATHDRSGLGSSLPVIRVDFEGVPPFKASVMPDATKD